MLFRMASTSIGYINGLQSGVPYRSNFLFPIIPSISNTLTECTTIWIVAFKHFL